MRVGFNPNKNQEIDETVYFHQVIIPVYIPHFKDYFSESFDIFKLSLESLFLTCHNQTYFTIINNGCCDEVVRYLDDLYKKKKIHTLTHTDNIGKMNAISKGLAGHNFALITITDADVLFLNNWQEETYLVFEKFPRTGTVCPTPMPKLYSYLSEKILRTYLFSDKLRFTKVKYPEALKSFALSIGNKDLYNSVHLNKILTLTDTGYSAVVGAGHFVATYRLEIFKDSKYQVSKHKMGDGLSQFLDYRTVEKGLWRLSTDGNYAYHMGNVVEPWMTEKISNLTRNKVNPNINLTKVKSNNSYLFRDRLFRYFFKFRPIRIWFLKYKGLTKQESNNYI